MVVFPDVLAVQLLLLVRAGAQHRVGGHGAVILRVVVGNEHGGTGSVVPGRRVLQLNVFHLHAQGAVGASGLLLAGHEAAPERLVLLQGVLLVLLLLEQLALHAFAAAVAALGVAGWLCAEELPNLADLQQQAGHGSRGVVQVLLVGVLAEHVVHRLAQLNELPLVQLGQVLCVFCFGFILLAPHSQVISVLL